MDDAVVAYPHNVWSGAPVPARRMGSTPLERIAVRRIFHRLLLLTLSVFHAQAGPVVITSTLPDPTTVILVVGAAGEAEYGTEFEKQATLWEKACRLGNCQTISIGRGTNSSQSDAEQLQKILATQPKTGNAELWLIFIGHGTFDNQDARINLRGPDITTTELATWLKPFTRPLAVIDTTSSSAPFLNKLSASNRVVVTATRSGHEQNYTRLGKYLAQAIADSSSDLDHDGQTSLLEAFLSAANHVSEFYKTEGRLATEHALLDDNGDSQGTPPDWFRGVRAVKKAKGGAIPDGARAHQFHLIRSEERQKLPAAIRARCDALELEILRLRETKSQMPEDQYYQKLEKLLLELARLL